MYVPRSHPILAYITLSSAIYTMCNSRLSQTSLFNVYSITMSYHYSFRSTCHHLFATVLVFSICEAETFYARQTACFRYRLTVCPSVCLSHAGVMPNRLHSYCRQIFFHSTYNHLVGPKFPTASPSSGALNHGLKNYVSPYSSPTMQ